MLMWIVCSTNQKASSQNWKASSESRKVSSESRKVSSEDAESFFRRALALYVPKNCATLLTDLRLGLL